MVCGRRSCVDGQPLMASVDGGGSTRGWSSQRNGRDMPGCARNNERSRVALSPPRSRRVVVTMVRRAKLVVLTMVWRAKLGSMAEVVVSGFVAVGRLDGKANYAPKID